MNQNFYNSNSSGFDQTQPPQFLVIHPPPQETSIEILHDQENAINSVQTFLRKFNRHSFFETPKVLLLAWDRVFEIKDAFGNKQYKPEDMQELFRKLFNNVQNIYEELAEYINTPGWNRPAFYNNDDDDDVDYTIAITPVLSTEKPDNSLSMRDEYLDTIPATESDEVMKSSVKDLVPIPSEFEGIPDTRCDVHLVNNPTPLEAKDHFEIVINSNDDISSSDDDSLYNENIKYVEASLHDSEVVSLEVAEIVIPEDKEIEDDNLREKLLNVNILIAKIEALPEFENFCFDLEEISSGGTTNHSDISLPDYESFYFDDDHIKEISSGCTTTYSDISLSEYDSFIFDLSNDQFPPTNMSDFTHEEFADGLAHIIFPPEYDCFYFRNLPDPGKWIPILNSEIRENLSSTTRVNLPVKDDHSPLLAYVIWIFLAYLMYPIIPPYLHSFRNEDTIFDPDIAINRFYSFKPGLSHRVSKIKDAFENKQYKPEDVQELFRKLPDDLQNIHEELAEFINSPSWNRPSVYDDDDDDVDYTIAITPVLSTEEPDNSLSMGDEHLDTIPATESDEVIKSSVEALVLIPSESEGIPDTKCDVHLVNNPTPLEDKDHFEIVINSNDDISSSDDDSLYYKNIEYVEASPHDSEFVSLEVEKIVIPKDEKIEDDNLREKLLKSSSTSPKPFLEETNTFHNSLPEFENFCFNLEETSSGNTTTHPIISLPEYEAFSFYDDHIEEIRSGSTTTQSDISFPEYDSFIFDLSNDQFPPTDRSDFTHEEFGDESAHIIPPPVYDCFYFENFPYPGELISSLNSRIRENLSSTTCVNLLVEDDYSPLLAYVVWIFLAYLTYSVIPPHLHSFGNEDTIFDPGITINRFYSFKPGLSHRCGTFKKFNTHRSHLNESPME
nr:hypothetical protein [Tanacetum cinerariifolium]